MPLAITIDPVEVAIALLVLACVCCVFAFAGRDDRLDDLERRVRELEERK